MARHPSPANAVDEVWHRNEAAWNELPVSVIQAQFDSIPKRRSLNMSGDKPKNVSSLTIYHSPMIHVDSPRRSKTRQSLRKQRNMRLPCVRKFKLEPTLYSESLKEFSRNDIFGQYRPNGVLHGFLSAKVESGSVKSS
ncbi:unnamed protein product [Larinioides sclopetarius]|uniref:Uncharacterized protein n=1 Tax=Larinioides sclopetarius TaxID=280406 RepID=A0AAV1ZLX0_9ARAC